MQLMLIFGVAFAIGAVAFALQNNVPVTVSFAFWSFESSLAMVLLIALGIGALIAGLMSTPAVIRGQWVGQRQRRKLGGLEAENAALSKRVSELESELAVRGAPVPEPLSEPPPVVGLTALFAGNSEARDKKG
jgi:lipopolysaccharide assembly protein A